MVTASEGRPTTVMKKPLTAPRIAPMRMVIQRIVSKGKPLFHISPMAALVSPTMLATDRSISPVMMMSVIGRARTRMGARSRMRKPAFRDVPNSSMLNDATTRNSTVTAITT